MSSPKARKACKASCELSRALSVHDRRARTPRIARERSGGPEACTAGQNEQRTTHSARQRGRRLGRSWVARQPVAPGREDAWL